MSKREIKNVLTAFFKKETVLCIASALAIITAFIVPPSEKYLAYIDFRVLSLLFSLMIVVAGFSGMGVFDQLLKMLLKVVHTMRQLIMVLVLVCFVLSMWITNDVALITFVPFSIMVLNKIGRKDKLIIVIVLQTVAANLGSMCTPIGNPQNLYLYSVSGMDIVTFVKILMPVTIVSLIMIVVSVLMIKNERIGQISDTSGSRESSLYKRKTWKLVVFGIMFVLSILTVLHIVDYRITLVLVIAGTLIAQPSLFKHVDYSLLITFIAFFVFVGNMKNIQAVSELLGKCIGGNEILVAVVASQFISNVPAAVLLSGFTDNYAGLMIGTNIGGLGTLIASMASLISYKFYICSTGCDVKKYIRVFTIVNVIYLIVLAGVTAVL